VTRNGTPARLLVSTPIEDRLHALEDEARHLAEWSGEDAPSVRSIRLCVRELRLAMVDAAEHWATTGETARLTGWSVDTLQRYAQTVEISGTLPHAWRGLRVRRAGSAFMFMVSTVPARPARAS